jgi:dephospho-CoA kinase
VPSEPTRPWSVGLTGGIGAGKSTVADLFAARGACVIDADLIAHRLTAPGGLAMPAIRAAFGDVTHPDGSMDRDRMREIVFRDPPSRTRLEAILHPLIRAEMEREAQAAGGSYVMFVVPLLVESGEAWRGRVDRICVIDVDEAVQVRRVMDRNGLAESQVRAILAAQAARATRLMVAHDVIDNNGEASALPAQVERLHALYTGLAEGRST